MPALTSTQSELEPSLDLSGERIPDQTQLHGRELAVHFRVHDGEDQAFVAGPQLPDESKNTFGGEARRSAQVQSAQRPQSGNFVPDVVGEPEPAGRPDFQLGQAAGEPDDVVVDEKVGDLSQP